MTIFPKSIKYIIGNEFAERFSFYGMKALLPTFLAGHFLSHTSNPSAEANAMMHGFIMLIYASSMFGAFLADWFLGKFKVIFWLSIVYCIGHLLLSIGEDNEHVFYTGLIVIGIGAGGIKPCVSANVGDQFVGDQKKYISKAFDLFYLSINVGAFISIAITPIIMNHYGPAIAFGIPGILMGLATFIFWLGRKSYINTPPSGFPKENLFRIVGRGILVSKGMIWKKGFWENIKDDFSENKVQEIRSVFQVLKIFMFLPFFWALYDQNGSEWVIQAQSLNLDWSFGTFKNLALLPEQVQTINPILIIIGVPLMSFVIFPFLEKKGITITPIKKFSSGLLFTAISFCVIAFIQIGIDQNEHPSVHWQFLAYIFLTIGEILVSITGLEFAYTQAPKTMKSTLMAFYFLTMVLGNYLVGFVNNSIAQNGFFAKFEGANFYWLFTAIGFATFITFLAIGRKYVMKEA